VGLHLVACQHRPASVIKILQVSKWHRPLFGVDLKKDDGHDQRECMEEECSQHPPEPAVSYEHIPVQLKEELLVHKFIENQKDHPQHQTEQDLIGAMHPQVHSGQWHKHAQSQDHTAENPPPPKTKQIRDYGLVQKRNSEAVATGVAEVDRAEPLPVVDLGVHPDGP
jgi:hypothetical protein